MDFLRWLLELDFLPYLGAASSLLAGLYTIALLIPGEQPDKAIKSLMDLTEKLSRK